MNKVLIAIPTGENGRRADFWDYFNLMEKPFECMLSFSHGQSPAKNRNLMIEQALENDCTHVFFIDDDMALPPDLLVKLLKHDVDIVSGFYLMRNYPHAGLIFDYADPISGKCHWQNLENNQTGLLEVVGTGFGCCLINTHVLLAMQRPWVRLGELDPEGWCDDLGFFKRAREMNKFKIYVDLDCPVGHMAHVIVRPEYTNGQWNVSYDTLGTSRVSFPFQKLMDDSVKSGSAA